MVERLYNIENVVATASIDVYGRLDLSKIVLNYPGVEYRPEMFPGAVFRQKKPKSATLIFATGKLVCTGTKSVEDAKEAIRKVLNKLESAYGRKIKTPKIFTQNIVASGNFHGYILLEELYDLPKRYKSMYEPEQFPGAIVRDTDEYSPKRGGLVEKQSVFLLFATGKFVCTGCKYEESLDSRVKDMYNALLDAKLLETETSKELTPLAAQEI